MTADRDQALALLRDVLMNWHGDPNAVLDGSILDALTAPDGPLVPAETLRKWQESHKRVRAERDKALAAWRDAFATVAAIVAHHDGEVRLPRLLLEATDVTIKTWDDPATDERVIQVKP